MSYRTHVTWIPKPHSWGTMVFELYNVYLEPALS